MVSVISAVAEGNYVIGNGPKIPWHIKEDFAAFKELTMGKPMIMGRATYESLPGILPGRLHVVVSSQMEEPEHERVIVRQSLDEAMNEFSNAFLCGGSRIYDQGIKSGKVSDMYISWVKGEYEGDVFFPKFDQTKWVQETRMSHPKFTQIHYSRP